MQVKRIKLVSIIVQRYKAQGKTEAEALALAEKDVTATFGQTDFSMSDQAVCDASKLANVLQSRAN